MARELVELDYAADEPVDGITAYTYLGGRGIVATIDRTDRQEARLRGINDDGDPTWTVRFTACTLTPVQLVTLYTVLYDGAHDTKTLVRTLAEALDVPFDTA